MSVWRETLVAALCVAACLGARSSTTSTTTPSPLPTMDLATSPASLTPGPPSPFCPEDAASATPLHRLRSAMRDNIYTQMNAILDAFLVFYTDEHLSEEPSAEERRLEYISGWDGPGTAAVLADAAGGAAVWVPAGEARRARAVLNCSWVVYDSDNPASTSVAEWIAGRVSRGGRVGADARLVSMQDWQELATGLHREGLQLIHMPMLLDKLWDEEKDPRRRRPEFSRMVAIIHKEEFTGMNWRDKVTTVRNELRASQADAMVVTALDEVAWLLNLRGRDMPYAPLLKAFVVVSLRELRVYAPSGKLTLSVREALGVFNCFGITNNCTKMLDYANFYMDLRRLSYSKMLIPTGGTFQRGASAAVEQVLQQAKRLYAPSPIIALKAQKNAAEVNGMRAAHLRDAVAMSTLLCHLEGAVKSGLTESSIELKVDNTRATQSNYVSASMRTRVSFGVNAADPVHRASTASSAHVYRNSTLVIQSGGQYDEGTTLVTRTLHYGKATTEHKRAYTTVLRSLAALASLAAPGTLPAAHADPATRAPLWAARQDYPHPTGHGVGAALNPREDPVVIDYRQDVNLFTLKEGYFVTSEPAWYEPNKFGVRLGNVLEVVSKPKDYLGFTEATLVPFEPNLIDYNILTEYEIKWLNAYNKRIRSIVGPELKEQGLIDEYYWMMNRTIPVELPSKTARVKTNSAASFHGFIGLVMLSFIFSARAEGYTISTMP